MKAALKQIQQHQASDKHNTDGRPSNMSEKRWKQHLAWKKVMDEGQSTPDTTWRTSSKNLHTKK